MRGTYEAFILVEIKDGTQYVCALNRQQKKTPDQEDPQGDRLNPGEFRGFREYREFPASQVIWN